MLRENDEAAAQDAVKALLAEARKNGLSADREGPFLLWVGNEAWEGRQELSLDAITANAAELVRKFKLEDVR